MTSAYVPCDTARKALVPASGPWGEAPNQRLATLFSYTNGGKGCAILDNNYAPVNRH
ncbi:hypothetical protein [Streptomyces sp. NPDC056669]|uniref:hypothetical protein n=1 Tax=unclassified Streptomyces TaxID=2593676 RepID=UPI00369D5BA2